MPRYRILSLDGGGSWALLQVMALEQLYGAQASGATVVRDFDLIIANSGGSIVAAGLYEDLPLAEMRRYFLDEAKRRAVFVKLGFLGGFPDTLFRSFGIGPRYIARKKIDGLNAVLAKNGRRPIHEAVAQVTKIGARRADLVIMGFDYDRRRAKFFRSNLASKASSDRNPNPAHAALLADAVHAATNAPVNYFDEPAKLPTPNGNLRFWDGAVGGYNNPAMAGVVEALANGQSPGDIDLLSIGTANVMLPLAGSGLGAVDDVLLQKPDDPGLVTDLRKLAGAILDDPPDAASFVAHIVLRQALPTPPAFAPVTNSAVVRMNALIRPVLNKLTMKWSFPEGWDKARFGRMRALDMDAIEQAEVEAIQALGTDWIQGKIANQAIRADSKTFEPQIGHGRFAEAKAAWLAKPK